MFVTFNQFLYSNFIKMNVLNIYIIHFRKLEKRLDNIKRLERLANDDTTLKINVHIVDEHQPDTINVNNIKNLVKIEKLQDNENTFYQNFVKQMSLEILSNTFNHFKAIQQISKNQSNSYNIILEDDVVYSDKIFVQMNTLINHVQSLDWNIIFLGQPSDKSIQSMSGLSLNDMEDTNLLLHCCESYMIHTETAKDLLLNFFPIRFSYNVQLSYLINKHKYKCMKIFPNICGDGSKMGVYTSSILINNVLIFNDIYKEIYILLEKHLTFDDDMVKIVKEKFSNNTNKENPDFVYLEALFYKRIGDIEKARELFETAMGLYEENLVPMNNTSTFLKNYIELYKVLQ